MVRFDETGNWRAAGSSPKFQKFSMDRLIPRNPFTEVLLQTSGKGTERMERTERDRSYGRRGRKERWEGRSLSPFTKSRTQLWYYSWRFPRFTFISSVAVWLLVVVSDDAVKIHLTKHHAPWHWRDAVAWLLCCCCDKLGCWCDVLMTHSWFSDITSSSFFQLCVISLFS